MKIRGTKREQFGREVEDSAGGHGRERGFALAGRRYSADDVSTNGSPAPAANYKPFAYVIP